MSELLNGKEVNRLGTGDYFGEVALFEGFGKRSRDVRVLCKCELFELKRADVMKVCEQYPQLRKFPQNVAFPPLTSYVSLYLSFFLSSYLSLSLENYLCPFQKL